GGEPGAAAEVKRWSAGRKKGVVLRLLRGEPVDAVSRPFFFGEAKKKVARRGEFPANVTWKNGKPRMLRRASSGGQTTSN
ncbi:hypothetical protein, partial [Zoogloea sp.]|uniref:hypothetical protein n=1 Tax=Zoogloea sp. TaxID=49181 RepID=UPI001AC0F49E